MNIFDLDKNSLPEQVQKNKENIATLMTDPTTKQYVDNQDAIMLQDAKDYADAGLALKQDKLTTSSVNDGTIEKNIGFDTDGNIVKQVPSTPTITAGDIDSGTSTAGQVLTSDGNGAAAWQTPSSTITASDVDSETATAGQVLSADGNGGASWQTAASGGGLTLLWSGSVNFGTGVLFSALSESIDNYKKVIITLKANDSYQTSYINAVLNVNNTTSYVSNIIDFVTATSEGFYVNTVAQNRSQQKIVSYDYGLILTISGTPASSLSGNNVLITTIYGLN